MWYQESICPLRVNGKANFRMLVELGDTRISTEHVKKSPRTLVPSYVSLSIKVIVIFFGVNFLPIDKFLAGVAPSNHSLSFLNWHFAHSTPTATLCSTVTSEGLVHILWIFFPNLNAYRMYIYKSYHHTLLATNLSYIPPTSFCCLGFCALVPLLLPVHR